jgi:hypothetical protein
MDEEEKAEFNTCIFRCIEGPATGNDKFRLSAPSACGGDLLRSAFTHRKRFRFGFEGDSGKTVYFRLRYKTGRVAKKVKARLGRYSWR